MRNLQLLNVICKLISGCNVQNQFFPQELFCKYQCFILKLLDCVFVNKKFIRRYLYLLPGLFLQKKKIKFIIKTCTSEFKRCPKRNTLKKCKLLFTENSAPACVATQQPHFKGSKDSVLHFYCRHVCQTLILKQYAATGQEGVILMRHSALSWRPFGNQHLSKQKWLQYKFQLIHD